MTINHRLDFVLQYPIRGGAGVVQRRSVYTSLKEWFDAGTKASIVPRLQSTSNFSQLAPVGDGGAACRKSLHHFHPSILEDFR